MKAKAAKSTGEAPVNMKCCDKLNTLTFSKNIQEQLVICLKQFKVFDWLRAATETNQRHQIALRMFVAREYKIGVSFSVLNCAKLDLAKLDSRPLDRTKPFLE